jgi:predicted nuclease with TOPRIM domain
LKARNKKLEERISQLAQFKGEVMVFEHRKKRLGLENADLKQKMDEMKTAVEVKRQRRQNKTMKAGHE